MKAVVCKSFSELESAGPGAVYLLDEKCLAFNCPRCGVEHSVPVDATDGANNWKMVGFPESITLTPSIQIISHGRKTDCHWHGFLRNSEWIDC